DDEAVVEDGRERVAGSPQARELADRTVGTFPGPVRVGVTVAIDVVESISVEPVVGDLHALFVRPVIPNAPGGRHVANIEVGPYPRLVVDAPVSAAAADDQFAV